MDGPCDWPMLNDDCDSLDELDDVLADAVRSSAVALLWRWTGQRFGLCEVTVEPAREPCGPNTYRGDGGSWGPVLVGGEWLNVCCGACRRPTCGCEYQSKVLLPGPAYEVLSVSIGGEVLEDGWRLENGGLLARQGGWWPRCGLEVTYMAGQPVPEGGQIAAGLLACEMGKAVLGRKGCQLPQRFTSVSREGVTIGAALDTFDDLQRGGTGIWLVDSWVQSVVSSPRKSRVWSPDARGHTHVNQVPS